MLPSDVTEVATKLRVKAKAKLLGSNSFRGFLYPSDVDLFSDLGKRTKEEAILKHFQKLFKGSAFNKKQFLFMDFKAGLNHDLVKHEDENNATFLKRTKHLISPARLKALKKIKNRDEYNDEIEDLSILRWTPDQILKGEQQVFSGKVIKFIDAIQDNTIIKLDVAVPHGTSFIDLTEVYQYKQEKSQKEVEKDLQKDIEFYSHRKTLKAMKRLYSLLLLRNEKKKVQRELVSIFNSPLGAKNKLMNDIDYFIDLTEKHNIGWSKIEQNLQMFKNTYFLHAESSPKFQKRIDNATMKTYRKVLQEMSHELLTTINHQARQIFETLAV